MIKIIDFITDAVFFDGYINTNLLLPEESHEYILISKDSSKIIRNIKNTKDIKILNYRELRRKLYKEKFDAVFIHSLGALPLLYYKYLPTSAAIFLFSWGYDIYQTPETRPLVPIALYHPLTQKYIEKSKKQAFSRKIRNFLKYPALRNYVESILIKNFLKRVNYHSGVLPYETDLIKHYNPDFKAKKVQFNYVDPNFITTYKPSDGVNILIGNSAAFTNNHLDVLELLKSLDTSGRKIVMPLSYGGTIEYREKVIESYSVFFKDDYIPLTDFIEKSEYYSILNSCSISIFYLERQQAMGNIYYCLRSGHKVFLSETSEVYKYLKKSGFSIFSIQSDLLAKDSLKPLDEDAKKRNYELWKANMNWKENRENIRKDILLWKSMQQHK